MNCRDMEILIQKAIDNNLSAAGQKILHAHLAVCPTCRQLYQEYFELDQLLQNNLPQVDVPADLGEKVMSAINEAKVVPLSPAGAGRNSTKKKLIVSRVALVAVAAALFLAVGFSGLFSNETNRGENFLPIADLDEQDNPGGDEINTPGTIDTQDPGQEDITDPDVDPEGGNASDPNPSNGKPEKDTQNETYGGGIALPSVAYGGANHGSYSLYTLASHEEFDAILPMVSGNTVTYYLNADGYYLEWQTDLGRGSEPSFAGEIESLPVGSAIAKFTDLSADYGYNYVVANSGDGMTRAINRGGDNSGLWLLDLTNSSAAPVLISNAHGGGDIVSWAPDSNKVLYTDAGGSLYVYYPNEKLVIDIYDGATSYVCWAGDSKNIVFSAVDSTTGRLSIFSVIVP